MARGIFGEWGADLGPDEFAAALAAAGIDTSDPTVLAGLEGRQAIPWNLRSGSWLSQDPHKLSAAWRRIAAGSRFPLRLAIRGWPEELRSPTLLLTELSRPSVGLTSVYLVAPPRAQTLNWSWPLRLGLMDEGRSDLRDWITSGESPLANDFIQLVRIDSPHPCDLLVTPTRLRSTLAQVLPAPFRASAVVMLQQLDEPWSEAHPMVDTLLHDLDAGAAIFAPVRGAQAAWFNEVLEGLARDQGLDAAVLEASRALELRPPEVLAEPRLLAETHLSRVGERLAMAARERPPAEPESPEAMVIGRGIEAAIKIDRPAPEELEELEEDLDELDEDAREEFAPGYGPAPGGAQAAPREATANGPSHLAEATRAAHETLPPPEPRFLQAQVRPQRAQEADPPAARLTPGETHGVTVRVGPWDAAWLTDVEAGEFPAEQLPPAERHRLTVVLTEPYLLEEPELADISLGPSGPSTTCTFWLSAPEEGGLDARISVLHEGRVLQSARLTGGDPATEKPLELDVDAFLHPAADLTGRPHFDAAFILNHDAANVPRVTVVAGDVADIREPRDLGDALETISARLEQAVTSEDDGGLHSESTRTLLVFLAQHGSLLHKALLDVIDAPLAAAERIQVVAADPEAFLPLEFAYSRIYPKDDAQLCPNSKDALLSGSCEGCPGETDPAYVCPLGFWCLSKVIERQLHTLAAAQEVERDYRILSAPGAGRTHLGPLDGALLGASTLVDKFRKGTIAEVDASLVAVTGGHATHAKTWTEWVERVKELAPPLLVLLPHTLENESSIRCLQIEDAEQLPVGEISDAYVGKPPPIVLLLGCDTATPEMPFQQFPTAFRRANAAIVVGTLTKILGRYAGPIASQLVTKLSETAVDRDVTFGEVMRDARRAMLRDGVPTVLAVTAYGDAGWMLGPGNGG